MNVSNEIEINRMVVQNDNDFIKSKIVNETFDKMHSLYYYESINELVINCYYDNKIDYIYDIVNKPNFVCIGHILFKDCIDQEFINIHNKLYICANDYYDNLYNEYDYTDFIKE